MNNNRFYIGKADNLAVFPGYYYDLVTGQMLTGQTGKAAIIEMPVKPDTRFVFDYPFESTGFYILMWGPNDKYLGYTSSEVHTTNTGIDFSIPNGVRKLAINFIGTTMQIWKDMQYYELTPVNPHYKELKKEYKKEVNNRFFREKLNGKMTLHGKDYDLVNAASISDRLQFAIYQNGKRYFSGYFNKTDCKLNHFIKSLELSVSPDDMYSKIVNASKTTYDLIKLAPAMASVNYNKRAVLQLYIQGSDVVSSYCGGTYWETETNEAIDSEDELIRKYYFSKGPTFREILLPTILFPGSTVESPLSGATFKEVNDDTWFCGQGNHAHATKLYFRKIYSARDIVPESSDIRLLDNNTSNCGRLNAGTGMYAAKYDTYRIELYQAGSSWDTQSPAYSSTYLYGKPENFDILANEGWYPMEARGVQVNTPTSFNLGDCVIEYAVFGRILCDVDKTPDGIPTYDLPYDDFAVNRANLKKCIGLIGFDQPGSVVKILHTAQSIDEPTAYGQTDYKTYFTPPYSPTGEHYLPLSRSTWANTSMWVWFNMQEIITRKIFTHYYNVSITQSGNTVTVHASKYVPENFTDEGKFEVKANGVVMPDISDGSVIVIDKNTEFTISYTSDENGSETVYSATAVFQQIFSYYTGVEATQTGNSVSVSYSLITPSGKTNDGSLRMYLGGVEITPTHSIELTKTSVLRIVYTSNSNGSVQTYEKTLEYTEPKFYEEVDYIYCKAANKLGIINTGYFANADDIITVEGDITGYNSRYILGTTGSFYINWNGSATTEAINVFARTAGTTVTALVIPYVKIGTDKIEPIHIIAEMNKLGGSTVNGEIIQSGATNTVKRPTPLFVFNLSQAAVDGEYQKYSSNQCNTFRLQNMQIKDKNGTLLYDFIPVKLLRDLTPEEVDGSTRFFYQKDCYGLYDRISGKFFGHYFDTAGEMCILGGPTKSPQPYSDINTLAKSRSIEPEESPVQFEVQSRSVTTVIPPESSHNDSPYNRFISKFDKPVTLRDAYKLSDVIKALLKKIDPSIKHEGTVEYSQYLYGNDGAMADNFMVYLTQKTNILKGDYDQAAQKAEITFEQISNMLTGCFRCYWFIENYKLKIEHVSFFNNGHSYSDNAVQLDLTSVKDRFNKKPVAYSQSEVSYDKSELSSVYEFAFADDVTDAMGGGLKIEVESDYIEPSKTENVTISGFTSDIDYMIFLPENFSKEGFALIMADKDGNVDICRQGIYDQKQAGYLQIMYTQNFQASFNYLIPAHYLSDLSGSNASCPELFGDYSIPVSGIKRCMNQDVQLQQQDSLELYEGIKTYVGIGRIESVVDNIDTGLKTVTLSFEPK